MLSRERAVTVGFSPWPAKVQGMLATMPVFISTASPAERPVGQWCKLIPIRRKAPPLETDFHRRRYDGTNDDNRNRVQSGCQAGRSVCNVMPFSQAFHDPQDNRLGDTTINCDEWPMATTKQGDFAPGQVRNSLRCIDQRENSSKLMILISVSSRPSRAYVWP